MWWRAEKISYTSHLFKNNFFKRFQGIVEDDFFKKLTRLQQKGRVEEFKHQWEALATRVFGLSQQQLLKTYVGGLKPYIQNELKLHDISSIEVERRKAKAAEERLEGISKSRFDNSYNKKRRNADTAEIGGLQDTGVKM